MLRNRATATEFFSKTRLRFVLRTSFPHEPMLFPNDYCSGSDESEGNTADNCIQYGLRCPDFIVSCRARHGICVNCVDWHQSSKYIPLTRYHHVIALCTVTYFMDVGRTTDDKQDAQNEYYG